MMNTTYDYDNVDLDDIESSTDSKDLENQNLNQTKINCYKKCVMVLMCILMSITIISIIGIVVATSCNQDDAAFIFVMIMIGSVFTGFAVLIIAAVINQCIMKTQKDLFLF